jgi:tetratricopeptide (TPR) repeat protein
MTRLRLFQDAVMPNVARSSFARRRILGMTLLLAGVLLLFGLSWWLRAGVATDQGATAPEYVGSQTCATCHGQEFRDWQGSQHAQAMQHATADTVLGDFADAAFTYAGIESRFYRRDGLFFVRTDGPDGQLAEFEIKYTFGLEPLQQYLVEFPDGRLQALSIAWDSRPLEQGGQRWFHLYPDGRVDHRDELHWTRPAQNWNFMCADCHSTNLRKGYDAETDRFSSRWSEISVGCEACHGPASDHLRWAQQGGNDSHKGLTLLLDERRGAGWRLELDKVTASRSQPPGEGREIDVCAQCHARRSQLAEGYHAGKPLLDHYRPALLEPPLYHADGQQRDEVFVWGSFLQSKMHARGVTCSDCHQPHTQKLLAEGNALCAQCHVPSHFDTPAHHFHPPQSAGAQCVNCHMPETTYMVVDPRRDHSLRIPRPDLSLSLGTPNACTTCHAEQGAEWAAEQVRRRYPRPATGYQDLAETFAAAEQGRPQALESLARLLAEPSLPALVRASAAGRLSLAGRTRDWQALRTGLGDPSALVRQASIAALEAAPAQVRAAWLPELLQDSRRSVRSAAARHLLDVELPPQHQVAFAKALDEYQAELELHADRAAARSALALLRVQQGRLAEAEQQLQAAMRLDPLHTPAYLNLADLRRAQGRDADAEQVLRHALTQRPEDALLHYALGLALVRQRHPEAALESLQRAHDLQPDEARMAYAYALALEPGQPEQALAVLAQALQRNPFDPDLLWAAASYSLKHGRAAAARAYAERLLAIEPQSTQAQALLQRTQAQ